MWFIKDGSRKKNSLAGVVSQKYCLTISIGASPASLLRPKLAKGS